MSVPSRAWGEKTADEAVGAFSNDPMSEPLTVVSVRREAGRTARLIEPLPQFPMLARWKSARIAIKVKGKILFVDAADVISVEARGSYVLLHRTTSSHMLREGLSTMEKKLNAYGFVRIHRSVLVNAALVEEMQARPAGEYVLRVKGGREYTVTRTYKKSLHLLAQSWIGTDGFVAQ